MRRAFHDPAQAYQTAIALPPNDLLAVIGEVVHPSLQNEWLSICSKLTQEDRAALSAGLNFAFHCGYSLAIDNFNEGKNLHQDYVNAAQQSAPIGPGSAPAGR